MQLLMIYAICLIYMASADRNVSHSITCASRQYNCVPETRKNHILAYSSYRSPRSTVVCVCAWASRMWHGRRNLYFAHVIRFALHWDVFAHSFAAFQLCTLPYVELRLCWRTHAHTYTCGDVDIILACNSHTHIHRKHYPIQIKKSRTRLGAHTRKQRFDWIFHILCARECQANANAKETWKTILHSAHCAWVCVCVEIEKWKTTSTKRWWEMAGTGNWIAELKPCWWNLESNTKIASHRAGRVGVTTTLYPKIAIVRCDIFRCVAYQPSCDYERPSTERKTYKYAIHY